ncbi:FAD-dependent oxidoreductase [Roseomonas sp. BN140053]|uniref:FAD-dependent oxidoreductase n=1 Tax=Roseomonas sp. BN140053 TaxID=3391898 RepID=UPI0039E85F60
MRHDAELSCDVLVAGSGAGALATAITATLHGLDVIVAEKAPVFGGTTALSGGGMWIPGNPLAARIGIADSPDRALTYMREEAGNHLDLDLARAFLAHGSRMVSFFEERTAMRFLLAPTFPDYHPDRPGASQGGRSLYAAPCSGRILGEHLSKLRPPLAELTLFGLVTVSGEDVGHFLKATRSPRSALHVARIFGGHLRDVLRHGRGMRLTNGNALAARLGRTLFDLNVPLWLSSPVKELDFRQGCVRGALVEHEGRVVRVAARRGVVLACGGFPHSEEMRERLFPHVRNGQGHHSPAPTTNRGDGLVFGTAAGGTLQKDLVHAAAWVPVSRVPRRDGSFGLFPHFIDRAKPGMIAVGLDGRRFVNEANSYHDFVPPMLARSGDADEAAAFLLCDHRAIRRYGLGIAKPFPLPLTPYLRSGYLHRGRSLSSLAEQIGLDVATLNDTVARFNEGAKHGRDPEFGKGETAYNRFMGDADHRPNPCLAPLEMAPFYAVRLVIGDLGTFAGLRTDPQTRVLDTEGRPVPGLHAVGNDMASVMGGAYPGGGVTLGPAMTFGYVAGCQLAGATP